MPVLWFVKRGQPSSRLLLISFLPLGPFLPGTVFLASLLGVFPLLRSRSHRHVAFRRPLHDVGIRPQMGFHTHHYNLLFSLLENAVTPSLPLMLLLLLVPLTVMVEWCWLWALGGRVPLVVPMGRTMGG